MSKPRRAGLAPLEQVVGEEGDMGAEGVGAELAGVGRRRLGERGSGQRERGEAANNILNFMNNLSPRQIRRTA